MIKWLEVKRQRYKPSFEDIIRQVIAKRNLEKDSSFIGQEARKRARKEAKDRERKEMIENQKDVESRLTSYLSGP